MRNSSLFNSKTLNSDNRIWGDHNFVVFEHLTLEFLKEYFAEQVMNPTNLEYEREILLWLHKGCFGTQRSSRYTWKRIPLLTLRVRNSIPTLYRVSHNLVQFQNKVLISYISKPWHLCNQSSNGLHRLMLRDLDLGGDLNNQHFYANKVFR